MQALGNQNAWMVNRLLCIFNYVTLSLAGIERECNELCVFEQALIHEY